MRLAKHAFYKKSAAVLLACGEDANRKWETDRAAPVRLVGDGSVGLAALEPGQSLLLDLLQMLLQRQVTISEEPEGGR